MLRAAFLSVLTCVMLGVSHLVGAEEMAGGRSPQEAPRHLVVPPGMNATLYASEPMVRQPILVKFDPRGRLWTLQYLQYPNPAGLQRVQIDRYSRTVYDHVPSPPPHGPRGADTLTMLLDHNHDGVADEAVDRITGLNLATGLEFGYGGWYVLQVPYLLFYSDRDGNDQPDAEPEVLLSGFGMEDAQSLANHLTWGPDGWLYGVSGSTSTNRIQGIEFQQAVWRYHPRRREFELFSEGGGNLFGLTFDERGRMFFSSNGGQVAYHGLQGAYYEKSFAKHGALHNPHAYGWFREIDKQSSQIGPTTGGTIYLGDTFPAAFRGTFIGGDFLGHTVSWWSISRQGTTFRFRREGRLLDPQDAWSGPTDVCLAPDGSIFVSDFYDARTAHPDPDANWDRSNGRIYRIQYRSASSDTSVKDTKTAQAIDLPAQASDALVDLLAHPNHWYRHRARVLLAERQDATLWPRLRAMARSIDAAESLEGLWALHVSGGLDEDTIHDLLKHSSDDTRAWTIRLVGDTRIVTSRMEAQFIDLARQSTSPIVRQQLASTAGRLPGASGVAIIAALLESDPQATDDRLAWLIWWSLEKHAMAQRTTIVRTFATADHWSQPAYRRQRLLLIRRYAAAGDAQSYDACAALANDVSRALADEVAAAIELGLKERGAKIVPPGDGSLFADVAVPRRTDSLEPIAFEPLSDSLRHGIVQQWQAAPDHAAWTRLAMRAGEMAAIERAITIVANTEWPDPERIAMLQALSELAPDSLAGLVAQLREPATEALRIAQIESFTANDACLSLAIEPLIVMATAADDTPIRRSARQAIFRRASTARRLLDRVDEGQLKPDAFTLDELRIVALHQDVALDQLVSRHWGTVRAGTPEEKLATMRRLMNDLRAASGDSQRGATLFRQHCATCHRLHGEGGQVGPDLTAANRTDRQFLLTSLVDPSSVVRGEYTSYVAITKDGQVLQGLLQEQDNEQIVLLDAKAQAHRLPRTQLESLTPQTISLMPEGLLDMLPPQDLRDLFAYLETRSIEK